MHIQGTSSPLGVPATPLPSTAQPTPQTIPSPDPNADSQPVSRLGRGRGAFTSVEPNVFENKSGTARIEILDNGELTITSKEFGEFQATIEDGVLTAHNKDGVTFTADIAGNPADGKFVMHNLSRVMSAADSDDGTLQGQVQSTLAGDIRDATLAEMLDTIA